MTETNWLMREKARAPGELAGKPSDRWPAKRKQALLRAIDLEAITEYDACERYGLTRLELAEWRRGILMRRDVQPERAR